MGLPGKILKSYIVVVTRFFVPVAIILAALTWFAFPKVVALFSNIQTDFKTLLPKDYESVKRLDEVTELFGSMKNMLLVLETRDPEATKKLIPKLAEFFANDEMVEDVEWRKPGYDFFDRHKLFFPSTEDLQELSERIDRRIQREKLGGIYIDFGDEDDGAKEGFADLKEKYVGVYSGKVTSEFYTDEDESVFLFMIFPKGKNLSISNFKSFKSYILEKLKKFDIHQYDPTLKLHFTGGVITNVHEYDSLVKDLKTAGIISGAAILLLMLLYFKNIRSVFFVAVPLSCGIIWNFAVAELFIGHLNMTTAFLFSILFGLGIDFGILLNSRYIEERFNGASFEDSIYQMLAHAGRSSLIAGATTSAAFLVLVINDFKGFSEFGFIAGIGIMLTLLAYVLILPVMFACEEKIPMFRRRHFKTAGWHLDKIARIGGKRVMFGGLAILAVSVIAAALFVRFDYNFENFRSPDDDIELAKELSQRVNPQKAVPSVILVHSKQDAEDARSAIEKVRDSNPNTLIHSAKNVYSLVPKGQEEKLPIMEKIGRLLEDDVIDKLVKGEDKEKIEGLKASAYASPFGLKDIPDKIKKRFLHAEAGEQNQLVYIFVDPEVDLKDGRLAMSLANEIREIKGSNGGKYHAISSSVIFADVLSVMLKDSWKAVLVTFVAVFILLLIDFKKISYAFLTMVPLIGGIVLMFGGMAVMGMHLNFFNMIVLPILLGMGIDSGVHFFHRFQEEGYSNIEKVMTTTGGAIVMTTLTTAAGFAGMCFAHHGGLSSIGITADMGMLGCLLITLFFFPLLLKKIWKA